MTTNLDNAGFAPALMDVLGRFHAEEITEAAAAAEVLALINRWYTYTGTLAETLTGYIGSIDGFIVTDGTPSDAVGVDGEYALDNTNGQLFGPKASGAWGSSILTLGGEDGADGRTLLFGTGAPASGLGSDGDGYIATDTTTFYGPKASGAWPTGVSLIGPKGDTGELAIGTVTTLAAGASATVTNSGTSTDAVLDFGLPAGAAATVSVGDVTGLTPGSTPTVANSGTAAAAVLDFGIPAGAAATVAVGTVTTAAAGESATVTNSGTSSAAVFDITIPQGPQGDGLEIDATGLFSTRSTYDAEAAGFVFLATDGEDGGGAPSVLYIREGGSGWSDAIPFQGEKGETGDAISLDGFVPYATIVTSSGDLIPGAAVQFIGTSEAVLSLDVTSAELGDLYPISNAGTADAQIDPGDSGGHIAIGSMSAGDRLTLEPGDFCTLVCSSLTGPSFTLHAAS